MTYFEQKRYNYQQFHANIPSPQLHLKGHIFALWNLQKTAHLAQCL